MKCGSFSRTLLLLLLDIITFWKHRIVYQKQVLVRLLFQLQIQWHPCPNRKWKDCRPRRKFPATCSDLARLGRSITTPGLCTAILIRQPICSLRGNSIHSRSLKMTCTRLPTETGHRRWDSGECTRLGTRTNSTTEIPDSFRRRSTIGRGSPIRLVRPVNSGGGNWGGPPILFVL